MGLNSAFKGVMADLSIILPNFRFMFYNTECCILTFIIQELSVNVRKIIAAFFFWETKSKNTHRAQNVVLLNITSTGTYNFHCVHMGLAGASHAATQHSISRAALIDSYIIAKSMWDFWHVCSATGDATRTDIPNSPTVLPYRKTDEWSLWR
jgi:hypothetical protein